MKLYISGRIGGLPRHIAEQNFAKAEELLSQNGITAINPLKLVPAKDLFLSGAINKYAMLKLIPIMLKCDGIVLLNDWQWSEGAKIEEALARYCGLVRIDISEFEQ